MSRVGLHNDINMSKANNIVSGVVGGKKRINRHDRASVLAVSVTMYVVRYMRERKSVDVYASATMSMSIMSKCLKNDGRLNDSDRLAVAADFKLSDRKVEMSGKTQMAGFSKTGVVWAHGPSEIRSSVTSDATWLLTTLSALTD